MNRLAALLALALLGAGAARADTVVLRDGRVISGRVIEQGDKIFIEHERYGGITVARAEVVRIETAQGQVEAPKAQEDIVVLRDGRLVRGDVRLSADGADVIVGLGERGEVRHPRGAVAVIRWRDGRAEATDGPGTGEGDKLQETIGRRLKELEGPDAALRLSARRELLALGAFARAYLDQLSRERPEVAELKGVLQDLDRLEAWRRVLPSKVEETVPHLGEKLVSPDAGDRESALRSVAMEVQGQAGPALLHAIRTDESPRVRAYGVSQLAALRRYEELAEVLKLGDGPLRLAAAFALGDAGIYAGIPILIEALRLSDVELRAAAIRKLTEYTGEHHGYRAQGSAEDREASIARWNAWWKENGARIVRESLKDKAPDSFEAAKVTREEAERAKKLWADGTAMIARAGAADGAADDAAKQKRLDQLDRAQELLRQALLLDPALGSARMTRAVLLFEELDRPRDAEQQLNTILLRAEQAKQDDAAQRDAVAARKFALYHLGRIALREGVWQKALSRFAQSADLDPTFVDAIEAQGDVHLAMGLAPPGPAEVAPTAAQRKEALTAARRLYVQSLDALQRLDDELMKVSRDAVADAPDSIEEGQVIQAVKRSRRDLAKRRGAVHFKVGRASAALLDDAAAIDAYQKAAGLDPENESYQQALKLWSGAKPAPEKKP